MHQVQRTVATYRGILQSEHQVDPHVVVVTKGSDVEAIKEAMNASCTTTTRERAVNLN